jgi:hypothetical protein
MNELPSDVKKLLEAARESYSPDDARVDAVRESLAARIAAPSGAESAAPASSGTSAAVATGAAWSKPIAILLAVAAGAGGVWLSTRDSGAVPSETARLAPSHPTAPQDAVQAVAPQAAVPPAAPAAALEADGAARAAQPTAARAQPVAKPLVSAAEVTPAPATRVVAPRSGRGRAASSARRVNGPSSSLRAPATAPHAPAVEPAPASPAAASTPDAPSSPAVEAAAAEAADAPRADPAAPPLADPLGDELALVRRARAALARDQLAEALSLSRQHASRFPHGTLRQERLATQILALCGLQRSEEARVLARELERVAPRSPHLMRLRASCVTEGGSGEVR